MKKISVPELWIAWQMTSLNILHWLHTDYAVLQILLYYVDLHGKIYFNVHLKKTICIFLFMHTYLKFEKWITKSPMLNKGIPPCFHSLRVFAYINSELLIMIYFSSGFSDMFCSLIIAFFIHMNYKVLHIHNCIWPSWRTEIGIAVHYVDIIEAISS